MKIRMHRCDSFMQWQDICDSSIEMSRCDGWSSGIDRWLLGRYRLQLDSLIALTMKMADDLPS